MRIGSDTGRAVRIDLDKRQFGAFGVWLAWGYAPLLLVTFWRLELAIRFIPKALDP